MHPRLGPRRWLSLGVIVAGLLFLLAPPLNEVLVVRGFFMLLAFGPWLDGTGFAFLGYPLLLVAGLMLVALPAYALFQAALWLSDGQWPTGGTHYPRIKSIALACGAGGWMALALFQVSSLRPFGWSLNADLFSAMVKAAISVTIILGLWRQRLSASRRG